MFKLFPFSAVFFTVFFTVSSVFASPAPNIVVSIAPLHGIVASVVENTGNVSLLLPPNVSAHDYQIKPSDIRLLKNADVIFYAGGQVETFLPKTLKSLNKNNSFAFLDFPEIQKLPARSGGIFEQGTDFPPVLPDANKTDGHFWFSPENAARTALITAKILASLYPEFASQYQENAERFARKARQIRSEAKKSFSPYANRPYLVFHDACQYFEKSVGLHPLASVAGDAHHSRLSVKRLGELRTLMRQKEPVCLFFDPLQNEKTLQTLTEGLTVYTEAIDITGSSIQSGKNFYFDLIHDLQNNLLECLKKLPESDKK